MREVFVLEINMLVSENKKLKFNKGWFGLWIFKFRCLMFFET